LNKEETSIWNEIDKTRLPKHVAIIMDGNGRWAEKKKMPRILGHRAGVKAVDKIVTLARDINLKALTLYSFSTENWSRPSVEVDALMAILKEYLLKEMNRMVDNNIRLNTIGNIGALPRSAVEYIEKVKEATSANDGTILTLALSYGSQDEILDAVRSIATMVKNGELDPADIDSALFSGALHTSGLPDVDMLIRTSGEVRISNFLLWQIAYAELFFTDVLWPDFSPLDFLGAIRGFQERERRFGKSGEQLSGRMV
jgi:undecaprenyl diphosphate synthase